jgi:ElaB/YqjD/DUF883 family membrane-anchored ribosome-binding protein
MQPDTARVSANGKGLGVSYLQDMVTPVRERLEDTARELSQALARAGDAVKQIRVADVAEIMRRSPLAALAVAAGIGLVAGIVLWSREK